MSRRSERAPDLPECDEDVMSNFDGAINPESEKQVRARTHMSRHAAWNFNGLVWFDGEKFIEEVWVYGTPVAVYDAPDLQTLMEISNDNHGRD